MLKGMVNFSSKRRINIKINGHRANEIDTSNLPLDLTDKFKRLVKLGVFIDLLFAVVKLRLKHSR